LSGASQLTPEVFMKQPVSCAVIGTGYWGPHLVRNVSQHPDTRLRWVIDLDADRARALAGRVPEARWSTRLGDALNDDAVDAVAIATPAATHHELARQCLEAGRHVLVEKPLATSAAQGRDLVELADRMDRVLMCDHTYCYTPAVRRLQAAVASGELGDLHYIDSVRVNLGLVQPDVDVVWDLAPHDLSILNLVLPEDRHVQSVSAHGADPLGSGKSCLAHLTLTLDGGALAHLHVNWLSPTKVRTMVVGGSQRTFVWDDLDPTQRVRLYDRGIDLDPAVPNGDGLQRRIAYRVGDMTSPALGEREALHEVIGEFANAISQRRAPLTDGRSGVWVLDVLEAAQRSLEHAGVPIPVSPSFTSAFAVGGTPCR
jgi:predicted dehydrogenase